VTTVSTGMLHVDWRPQQCSARKQQQQGQCGPLSVSIFPILSVQTELRSRCICNLQSHNVIIRVLRITVSSAKLHHRWACGAAEDLPPRRSIALPPEEYLTGLRTPAPELVLAEFRLRTDGGAAPVAPPAPVDVVPADVEVMTEASKEGDGPQSPASEAGAQYYCDTWPVHLFPTK